MIFLCIAALWILGLASVAGLCIAASRGDSIQARTEPSVDEISVAAPFARQRANAGERDPQLGRAGRAAA
jgi:hypothetical protein